MKNKSLILISAVALWLGLGYTTPSQAKVVDSIALIVDQDSMTQGELEDAIQAYLPTNN